MNRFILLLHRYLGIVACLLVAAWCLSGLVMMYVGYPTFSQAERIASLAPLDWRGCCDFERARAAGGEEQLESFKIEMLASHPVLRAVATDGARIVVDLVSAEQITRISPERALEIARSHAAAVGSGAEPGPVREIKRDQWTVSGAFNADRPLYLVPLNDEAGTQLYISSRTGEIVQDTTATERVWNWFGAVTHWLYPTILRQRVELWSQIVIWTSLAGTVLAAAGLYLGVTRLEKRGREVRSPFRGLVWWHHVLGLTFGVLAVSWLLSGLFSMHPWGLFEGEGDHEERQQLAGMSLDMDDAFAVIQRLAAAADEPAAVHVASAPLEGKLFLKVRTRNAVARVDAETLAPAPLDRPTLEKAAARIRPDAAIGSATWLTEPDAYYYADHNNPQGRTFPVLRVVLNDQGSTRYYLDALDGSLLLKADRASRWSRWWFEGLHRLDFLPLLRQRPLWDLIVVPLLLGVTAVSLTGVYMSFRYLTRQRSRARLVRTRA